MAGRIDYYNDPDAPRANSVVPSANVVVVNDIGEILLIRRSDNDNWALPGDSMDLGESLPEAARRETNEETGVRLWSCCRGAEPGWSCGARTTW